MAKAAFKCPKCDRSFSMKAHLARHTNTIHASPKRRKAAAKKRARRAKLAGKKRVVKRKARVPSARKAPVGGGSRVLREMKVYHADLAAMRSSLDAQIGAIEAAMEALTGIRAKAAPRPKRRAPARGRGRGRAGRAGSLKDSVVGVLRKHRTPMSPRELSSAVVRAGYKTKAKDLTKAISNILPQLKMVKKVGRGMYRA